MRSWFSPAMSSRYTGLGTDVDQSQTSAVLRYRCDWYSLVTVLVTLLVQLIGIVMAWHWLAFIGIVLLVRQTSLVQHNHIHLPIFRGAFLNEALSLVCTLSCGVPTEGYFAHHVLNHHKHNNDPHKDWSSIFDFQGAAFPGRPVSILRYSLAFPLRALGRTLRFLWSCSDKSLRLNVVRSVAIAGAVLGGSFFIDPVRALLFLLIPWSVVWIGLGVNNFRHHAGCAMTSQFDSSMNNMSIFGTYLGFNIGFHTAHHLRPGLHWSLLPQYHGTIEKQIPSSCYRGKGYIR